jgi:hypothetical protein
MSAQLGARAGAAHPGVQRGYDGALLTLATVMGTK